MSDAEGQKEREKEGKARTRNEAEPRSAHGVWERGLQGGGEGRAGLQKGPGSKMIRND